MYTSLFESDPARRHGFRLGSGLRLLEVRPPRKNYYYYYDYYYYYYFYFYFYFYLYLYLYLYLY